MELSNAIKKKNVLVIGDVMLDTYYNGNVKRISPEAPVPVFLKKSERSVLGGAANVAANLVAANQNAYMMSLIGDDQNGQIIESLLQKQNIDTSMIMTTSRNTTVKTRFIASNNQQVLRLDVEDTQPINSIECNQLLEILRDKIDKFDLIVISDYMKGLLSYEFTQGVIKIANQNDIKVIIDVKDSNFEKYNDCYLLKPNILELRTLTGMSTDNDDEIIAAANYLRNKCSCKYVLTTCGARGMILVGDMGKFSVNSVGKEVFDVTGAGDTTIAYLAACMSNELDIKRSIEVSNYAAGIQVAKVGTSSVYLQEVIEFLSSGKQGVIHKLISNEYIDTFREANKSKKIVFTNGCFDILHVGHIRYLQEASTLGDLLVVAVNSDASVKRLKGDSRPINTEKDRAELLCALEYVDYVVIFDEDTPLELIRRIQPDVLVKGGDYKPEEVVGRDVVEARGGELRLIQFVEGKSTTNIIRKIES